jgi:murein DD-endopeptidase MepM/ murein hydrolase activator NlpD
MPTSHRELLRTLLAGVAVLMLLGIYQPLEAVAVAPATGMPSPHEDRIATRWVWPLPGAHAVVSPFRAPMHAYAAGHRGIDLPAPVGTAVLAPADGVVAFSGTVVDRPVLTVRHADGLVSTLEPLSSALAPGDAGSVGDELGLVSVGGHAARGSVHLGVRLNGAYINPMLLFDPVERAVLLPCCAES